MVETSTAVLAGIGGLIATEATGVTNLSGGGGESPLPAQLPGGGGPSVGELFALAQSAGGAGETVTRVVESGGGDSGAAIANAFAQIQQSQTEALERVAESSGGGGTTVVETVREATGTDTGRSDPGRGRQEGPGGFGLSPRQQAAAMVGRDPFGLQATTEPGSRVGQAAEALNQAGQLPGKAADFSGRSGRTVGEAFSLLTTGKADTEGTFQEGRGEVGLDFSDDGDAGGKLTDRLPDWV